MEITKIKNSLYFIITFLTSFMLYSQDCKDVKNGKFKITDNELNRTYIIERHNDLQTEICIEDNSKSEFRVKWLSECEYVLYPTSKSSKEILESGITALYVRITDIKNNQLHIVTFAKEYPESVLEVDMEIMRLK